MHRVPGEVSNPGQTSVNGQAVAGPSASPAPAAPAPAAVVNTPDYSSEFKPWLEPLPLLNECVVLAAWFPEPVFLDPSLYFFVQETSKNPDKLKPQKEDDSEEMVGAQAQVQKGPFTFFTLFQFKFDPHTKKLSEPVPRFRYSLPGTDIQTNSSIAWGRVGFRGNNCVTIFDFNGTRLFHQEDPTAVDIRLVSECTFATSHCEVNSATNKWSQYFRVTHFESNTSSTSLESKKLEGFVTPIMPSVQKTIPFSVTSDSEGLLIDKEIVRVRDLTKYSPHLFNGIVRDTKLVLETDKGYIQQESIPGMRQALVLIEKKEDTFQEVARFENPGSYLFGFCFQLLNRNLLVNCVMSQ